MNRTLYIFTTTERPDQYLNPILHCLRHENVNKIVFLNIVEDTNEIVSRKIEGAEVPIADKFRRNVVHFVNCLAIDGDYTYFVEEENHKPGEKVPLRDIYHEEIAKVKKTYQFYLDKDPKPDARDIPYKHLRKEIANIHDREPNCLFDISGMNKKYVGDITAISTVEDIREVYTFALLDPQDYRNPWKMLYHEVGAQELEQRRYNYANIVGTDICKECRNSIFVRKLPLKVTLIVFLLLIALLSGINFVLGANNALIQVLAVASGLASLLSIFLSIYRFRKV